MDWDLFYNCLIFGGLGAIFLAGGMAYYEFHGAEAFCKSIGGNYSLQFFPLPPLHECNGENIVRYSKGWSFQVEYFNYSINFPQYP